MSDKQLSTGNAPALPTFTPEQEATIKRLSQFAYKKAAKLGHAMDAFTPSAAGDAVSRPDEYHNVKAADAIVSMCNNNCCCMMLIYVSGKIEIDYQASPALTEQCEPDPVLVEYMNKHKVKIA